MDLVALVEKTVTGMGYEFVALERVGRGMVRVFIDHAPGVGVEDCARVSHQLTHLFVAENVPYDRLEISSPGLDRLLRHPADFERFCGRDIKVRVRLPRAGKRNFEGRLTSVTAQGVVLESQGEALTVTWEDLERANLVPEI